jgi:hypothetical protein
MSAAVETGPGPSALSPRGDEVQTQTLKSPRFLPSWPLIVAFAAMTRALAQPNLVLGDPDTYLHVAAGQWIIDHRALPLRDSFSHTMLDARWVPHEWLSEIIMAAVYDLAGWRGLILMTGALFAVSMAVLTRRLLRHGEPLTTMILVFAVIALQLPHLLARPHLLALPVMVVWVAGLFDARDNGRAPSMYLLPLMVLWASLHGGFMFGIALTLYLGLEAVVFPGSRGRVREALSWGRFFLGAIVASLLTPLGIEGFLQPFRLIMMPAVLASIVEWLSPNFQFFEPIEIWLLGAIFIGFVSGARLPFSRVLLLLGLFHMSLQHSRHQDLLSIVAPLAVAASLGPQIATRVRSVRPSAFARLMDRMAAPASMRYFSGAMILLTAIGIGSLIIPLKREDGGATPGAALAAAKRMGLSGPVFNTEAFGGYLIFNGIPTFIDGRFEMFGNDFLNKFLKGAHDSSDASLVDLLDRYRVSWTLLAPGEGAVAALDRLPGWRRVYTDHTAVVHVRQSNRSP